MDGWRRHDDLFFEFAELIDGDVEATFERGGGGDGGGADFGDAGALRRFRPAGEGLGGEIAREADAGHQDDRGLVAGRIGQLGGRGDERGDRHG